jgi:hypothetical protein
VGAFPSAARRATSLPLSGVIQLDCALCEVLNADWLV